jgi:hypothetical protein
MNWPRLCVRPSTLKEAIMVNFNFADRYAEASLAPTAQMIASRQAPADRIVAAATNAMIMDLVTAYYASPDPSLTWLRDEFLKEDASFSLVNNDREARVLAGCIIGALVATGNAVAILAVLTGRVAGLRQPSEATWLLQSATSELLTRSVAERQTTKINTKVANTTSPKLTEEIAALPVNDWTGLLAMLGKIRAEAQSSASTTSKQVAATLEALDLRVRYLREESQMLWWLFGGHSRSLKRSFTELGPQQAALAGAVDLSALTTISRLGPVAVPAVLERIVIMARKPEGSPVVDLASAVDGLPEEDLKRLEVFDDKLPAWLAPITAAVSLARTMGTSVWHTRFRERTGLEATLALDPIVMGEQLYRECLLGQLL